MNVKLPRVSIVIPCYNYKDYIEETLASILNQSFKDFEVIIVDDGSNKETKDVLRKIKNSKITILEQQNAGPSIARNNGVKKALGEYILTLDSDDTFHTSFLERAVAILDKDKNATAVSCHCNIFTEKSTIIDTHTPKGGGLENFLFDNNSTSFALIRKSFWEKIGGYDEKMINGFEDWEFWISFTRNGGFIYMIPELLFNYRHKKKSLNVDSKENYREENLSYIYKKHQDIYKNHFPEVIDYLSELAIRHKRNEKKYKNSIDFKIGKTILSPFRYLKRLFNQ